MDTWRNGMKKIIVILIILCFFFSLTPAPVSAQQMPEISNVRVSNPSCSSATVSWVASSPSMGRVDYGLSKAYGEIVYDNNSRMNGVVEVEITGLAKETTYHYMLTAVNNNGEKTVTGSFKTAKDGFGASFTPYGQIICHDGSPAPCTMVYVTVEHQGVKSQPLSVMTSSDGYWSVDLANLKDTNGGVYQWYNGDSIKIEAQGGTLGYGVKQGTIGLQSYYSQIFLGTPEEMKEPTLWDKLLEYKILFIGASA
ncbi:fibronectin type III domain-containing protein, partial [archaeon]|nr:fibronectin type III domain-containing protein [archaeon]